VLKPINLSYKSLPAASGCRRILRIHSHTQK
jgi:hypothetical protein